MTGEQTNSGHSSPATLDMEYLLAQVQQLIAELYPAANITIKPDSHLETDLGLDSMARVELFTRLEKITGRAADDVHAMQATTPLEVLAAFSAPFDATPDMHKKIAGNPADLLLLPGKILPSPESTTRSVREWLYAIYCLSITLVLGLFTWILLIPNPFESSRRCISRNSARLLFWLIRIPVSVNGHERLDLEKPAIFAINHASYLDGIVIAATLNVPFHIVVKKELASNLPIRLMLERFGVEFVDRFNPHRGSSDLQRITERAKSGCSLVFFPEGTFIDSPGLQAFRMGAFVAASKSGLPVVPIAIKGTRAILQGDSWFPRRGCIDVSIRPPVISAGKGWQESIRLKETVRQEILNYCGEPDARKQQHVSGQNHLN